MAAHGRYGRLLAAKRQPVSHVIVGALVLAGFILQFGASPLALVILAGCVSVMAAAMLNQVRVYERGVVARSLLGTTEIGLDDVVEFSYSATRFTGSVSGLQLSLRVSTAAGEQIVAKTASLAGSGDAELEALRDRLTDLVVGRMADALRKAGQVRWGHRHQILLDRVRDNYQSVVSLTASAEATISSGSCSLRSDAGGTTLCLVCSEPNFYPGLTLVANILARHGQKLRVG